METGGYDLPQGMIVDSSLLQTRAVPRKTGAYDTEGFVGGGATALVPQLVYFQSTNAFVNALAVYATKVYGRDTNLTSRNGGMGKGERLYGYGLAAKMDVAGGSDPTLVANITTFDIFRRIWSVGWFQIRLGGDEFITGQLRDIPVTVAKRVQTTHPASVVHDIQSDWMHDITINGDPYIFDQQEDFRVDLNFNQGTVGGASLAIMPLLETVITVKIEGIRLKALRA